MLVMCLVVIMLVSTVGIAVLGLLDTTGRAQRILRDKRAVDLTADARLDEVIAAMRPDRRYGTDDATIVGAACNNRLDMFEEIEDAAEVGMGHFARDANFTLEALESIRIRRLFTADGLQADAKPQALVPGFVHLAHPSAAVEPDNAKPSGNQLLRSENGRKV